MRYLILLLLLSGCASTDGGVKIVWHRITSPVILSDGIGKNTLSRANGRFAIINGVCHVWAPDPPVKTVDGKRVSETGQWGTLGHEVKHCFDGLFHD